MPKRRVFVADRFDAGLRFVDGAGGENIHAHDLQLGRRRGACEHRPSIARDRRRQNLALFEQRRHQPERLAAMLRAFADREDIAGRRFPCNR